MNEFLKSIIKGDTTKKHWKENLERNYDIYSPGKIKEALKIIAINSNDK